MGKTEWYQTTTKQNKAIHDLYCMKKWVNSSPLGQNDRHFTDNIFRCIFVNEKFCILVKISLKFVPKGLIDNKPALVEIMAWRQIGDKPLSEPMLTQFTDAYMRHKGENLIITISAACRFHIRTVIQGIEFLIHGQNGQETILSLLWESLCWQNDIFIFKRPPNVYTIQWKLNWSSISISNREIQLCYRSYIHTRVDSRLAPSQWETLLQSNGISLWLGTNLESALHTVYLRFVHNLRQICLIQ